MVQSPWDDSHLASQIPSLLRNPKFQYCVQKSQPETLYNIS
jgi:hypothetical protein